MPKKLYTIPILIVFLFLVVYFYLGANVTTTTTPLEKVNNSTNSSQMKITSPAFSNSQPIPVKYTCDGADVNPPLTFENIPEGAQSLALIVDDPDATMGTWVHWLVFNISPQVEGIDEDSVPQDAVEGTTDFGDPRYGGPCPPSGTHRYYFKLYAIDTKVGLTESATKEELLDYIEGHILGYSELIGLYSR